MELLEIKAVIHVLIRVLQKRFHVLVRNLPLEDFEGCKGLMGLYSTQEGRQRGRNTTPASLSAVSRPNCAMYFSKHHLKTLEELYRSLPNCPKTLAASLKMAAL